VKIPKEYGSRKITLVDLNTEGKYELHPLLTPDLHVQPVRLAARLCDPDAFIICSAILKTHNTVVATLSVKNMVLGAPIRSARRSGRCERQAQVPRRRPPDSLQHDDNGAEAEAVLGATLIDGFEGMEGNGPGSGTPVESRVAIASTTTSPRTGWALSAWDQPNWMGYLNYCEQVGIGTSTSPRSMSSAPRSPT